MQSDKDWELIVVNDGSTDKTAPILSTYKERLGDKMTILTNDANVGVGISRKRGIDVAKGEFITFVDSDDFITPNFLEVNNLLQKQHDSDIVYTSTIILYPEGRVENVPSGDYIMTDTATVQCHFNNKLKFLTGKLFRKSILEKITFSPKRIGEDVQTVFFATYIADKVRSSNYAGYVHAFREGSLLANAPGFFCFCHSELAQIEIIEFLKERDDKVILPFLLKNAYDEFNKMQLAVKQKQIAKKELDDNIDAWNSLKAWYKKHTKWLTN
jgi:glycosyltransferase involved in cell wall biosynthesis